jgi:MFS family permease
VPFSRGDGDAFSVTVGGKALPLDQYAWDDKKARTAQLKAWLNEAGYSLDKTSPTPGAAFMVFLGLLAMMVLSAATYGSVAALLTEMFPPSIRYSSMSIPYHIGAGYFGGFLPFISGVIVATTGNPYSGLWYTWVVVLIALIVAMWGLKGGPPGDYDYGDPPKSAGSNAG